MKRPTGIFDKVCECCDEPAEVRSFTYWDAEFILRESPQPSYFCRDCFLMIECENADRNVKEGAD